MKTWLRSALGRPPQTKSSSPAQPLVALQLAASARWTPRGFTALARAGYERNAIAYRCVRLIAEAAASVPLMAGDKGKTPQTRRLSRLLTRPGVNISRAEFFEQLYGYLQLSGDSFIEMVLLDGEPVAMFTLRPDRMRPLLGARGQATGWIFQTGNKKRQFRDPPVGTPSRLHHLRLFHPLNDLEGFSPLQAAARAVDIHNAGSDWTKSLLDNAARPSGALIYKGQSGADHLSDEQFARLKSELESRHSGAQSAGRPLLLEGGLDWKAMSLSPTDMDFINARREAAREIALAFGVPPMLLGIPGDNTYANYKEANLAFWRQTILPLVRKTADSLGGWLSEWFETDARLHVDETAIPALAEERTARLAALNASDFLSADEKRALAGLPSGGGAV
ncbi:MAG TPA: phage portal protein [Hellea balneolensis]|uniref:Phage portal protein n=1 Tax=Hellea balneolensis TaxID=287478 RepID=A0A7V5U175_9PROT|nr:phage portal protein [Hellea balneolensis]